ncbi:hypothetical protein ACFQY5_39620 [Paeniroseomonas aquatica]|uniref:Uncharacterized protein n=1 Tax=Paeniroseomonas aquatica TaxID=373043 RepID=A0ABT8A1C2_9PROT|nr:hypothetical protein [Paeniroseomonas aquatica]MDN3563529.1 hypothetical protein [Paeniroseomonas aquatica]
MDGTGTDEAPRKQELASDDPVWAAAVPFPPGLVRRLEALAAEIGMVDLDTPIVVPVALGESEPH